MVGQGSPEDICSRSLIATANQLLGVDVQEDHWKSDLFNLTFSRSLMILVDALKETILFLFKKYFIEVCLTHKTAG